MSPPFTESSSSSVITLDVQDAAKYYAPVPASFTLKVINEPPVFTSLPLPMQTIHVGSTKSYSPPASDPEGAPITYSMVSGPLWVTC